VDIPPTVRQNGTLPTRTGGARGQRLLWLDALRGLAALVVVFEHLLDALLPEVRRSVSPWFDFGRYGVFVFFIVSGYVVPASLERRGSLREFWIGRVFRLYPLWALAAALGLVFALVEVFWGLPEALSAHPWASTLAHVTMLQDLLQVPSVLNVFWTLSYEMVFYLLVTAMFAAGVHRASAGTALGFGLAALTLGVALPAGLLSAAWGPGTVVAVSVLILAGLAAVLGGRSGPRPYGAVLLGVTAIGLLTLNSRVGGVESLAIMATMFAGTAVHRIQHGQRDRRPSDWLVLLVPLLSIAAGVRLAAGWGVPGGRPGLSWGWPAAMGAAWLTFALALTVRHRGMPRLLPWLGVISYSVYLLHQLPLQLARRMLGDPAPLPAAVRAGWGVAILAAILVCSALAYRYVERPMQQVGRRVSRRSRERWPDSRVAAHGPGLNGPAELAEDTEGRRPVSKVA
jgi:peptidoglycan/LPS O-acetylase OafA/YrhL